MSEETEKRSPNECPTCRVTYCGDFADDEQCFKCHERDDERRAAWAAFAAAAWPHWDSIDEIAAGADRMLREYDARFPKRRAG